MVFAVMMISVAVLLVGGRFYSRFLARSLGEDDTRPTPAVALNDGRDYVPTPTWIVFAHHFASIAGAGPIVGPVLAIGFGWLPALLWVLIGGLFFGAVHDYLATYMATRSGGESMASLARKLLGRGAFIAFALLLVVLLLLVCAQFLNLSAAALTSAVDLKALGLGDEHVFRTVEDGSKVVIGGIASTNVIIITCFAPLVGFLYIKKQVPAWKCSLLAIAICAVSITTSVNFPITVSPTMWKCMLSGYVLLASGVPVWMFLQSRDFINVHILYAGLAALLIVLLVAGAMGLHLADANTEFQAPLKAANSPAPVPTAVNHSVQPVSIGLGETVTGGAIWPMLFITIACGAVSGFHSLCAGGTTSKQLTSERACRQIGYWGMLLESFLAVCVIAVLMIGLDVQAYIRDVYPKAIGLTAQGNPVVAFAVAVGRAAHMAIGAPIIVGTLAGMILLEGFVITTLDTAVRLTRYLVEEVWRALFEKYDVYAKAGHQAPAAVSDVEVGGSCGLPAGLPATPGGYTGPVVRTRGALRASLMLLQHYWFNSGLVVGIMLVLALSGGVTALWSIFGSANQLLASLVLCLATLWLLRQGKRTWFAVIPAVIMMTTTSVSLVQLLVNYLKNPSANLPLIVADILIMALSAYLLVVGAASARQFLKARAATALPVGVETTKAQKQDPTSRT